MALLEKMMELDILDPIGDLLGEQGTFRIFHDNKIRSVIPLSVLWDGPWINVRICPYRNCFLWHSIYFNRYGIIYRKCFNCWKVVIKPQTLEDLMTLLKIQTRMDLPSKCGIERRDYARHGGKYSGFFYAPLSGEPQDGHKLLMKVRSELYKELPLSTPIFLKRGCTEMENKVGPSNEWVYPERQKGFEAVLDAVFDIPPLPLPSPSLIMPMMFRKWIGFAYANGDPTTKKYYDDERIFGVVPTIKYGTAENKKPVCVPSMELENENRDSGREGKEVFLEGLPED